jgi:aspartyl-tRNA(Asn)/glutamyl-tRNA(Gln) amidotransferase subunit A
MGPLALGTDGGGSIRIPAACCGVVGFKPTLGVVPHLQLPDLFGANSYVGPMARTVADAELMLVAIAGSHPRDPYGQAAVTLHEPGTLSLRGLRIAWIARGGARVEKEVASITGRAVEAMAAEGARVEAVEIDFKSYEAVFLTLLRVGLAARTGPMLKGREALVSQSLLETIALGEACSAIDLAQAASARTGLFQAMQSLFETFDLVVSPTLTAPPLPIDVDPIGDIMIDGHNEGTVRGAWYPFTFPQNLTGHPAISLPCGRTPKGLPVGLQICAPWYRDRALLTIAAIVEDMLA